MKATELEKTSEMKLLVLELETLITDKECRQLFETKRTRKLVKVVKEILRGDIAIRDAWVVPTKRRRRRKK